MRWNSLRLRLVAGGIVAILIALTIAGAGLILLFERHVARTIADDLDVHLKQLLAGIDVDPQGRLVVTRPPADPRFADPLSGLYWQVSDDRGQLLRSRSLWDTTMSLPVDEPAPGEMHRHEVPGPGGARMLVAERAVSLAVGDRRVPVRVAVAADLARVSAATAAFAKDLALALALLGLVLAVATSIQVGLGLRPLDALRRGVADIRAGAAGICRRRCRSRCGRWSRRSTRCSMRRSARSSARAAGPPISPMGSRRRWRRSLPTRLGCANTVSMQSRRISRRSARP